MFQGPTPLWATNLNRWSDEQGQPLPYNGDRSFYNISKCGSADRALPILVRRIAQNLEQGRAAIGRVAEIDTNTGVNTVRICHLKESMERTGRTNGALHQQLAASRAEVIELRVHQRAHEQHPQEVVRQMEDLRVRPRNSHHC